MTDDVQSTPAAAPADVVVDQPVDLALADLREKVSDLHNSVSFLEGMRDDGFFKYLSKQRRNDLLNRLMDDAEVIRELIRAAHGGLKKIKRERIPEEVLDQLITARVDW